MIDKIGFASELDLIETLPTGLGKGPGKSDREPQLGGDFRDVLASEMTRPEESPAAADQRPPRPSAEPTSNTATAEEDTPTASDRAKNTDSSSLTEKNPDDHPAKGPEPGSDPPPSSANVTAGTNFDEADHHTRGKAKLANSREEKESHVTMATLDLLEEKDSSEELAPKNSHEDVVDVLGISPSGLAVTMQIVAGPAEQGSDLAQSSVPSESDAAEETGNRGELQQRLARSVFHTAVFAEKTDVPSNANPVNEATSNAALGLNPPSVSEATQEIPRRLRASSHEQSQWKKESPSSEKEDAALSSVPPKKALGQPSSPDPILPSSTGTAFSSQTKHNDLATHSRELHDLPKQDLSVSGHSADLSRTEGTFVEQTANTAFRQPMSRLTEQAEHLVTIQRVVQAIRLAHERNGEIRLRLHPPELGALRLQMRVQEGTLTARLEVETPAAREVLLENLPNLRDRLAEHNIRVDNFDVTLMNDGFGGQPSGREDFAGPRHSFWTHGTNSEPQSSKDRTDETRGSVIRRVADGQFDVVI
ncbi:MAG: flagellar hook-length control protein FliK [Thermogutta sp.]